MLNSECHISIKVSPTHSMMCYAQYLVSVHAVTLSHSLCCHHWLCSIVVGCALLGSTIVPHQSALYGYHATNTVVLEWCSVLMYVAVISGWVVGWCNKYRGSYPFSMCLLSIT